ncbi:MAG: hypothetical protein ACYS5V_03555, partial [Planctomycetota bacterium]
VFVDDDEWTWEQFKKWHSRGMVRGWLGRIEGSVEPWGRRESAIEVLKLMVSAANGDDSRRRPNDGVVWGVVGIEAYADDLADMSKSGAPEDKKGYFQGGWRGCHNVYPQMSGRPAAATYLKRIAPAFQGDTKEHILAAGKSYEDATGAWRAFEAQLGRPVADKHNDAWQSEANRVAGAKAVREAAGHERKAIAELTKALAAEGVTVPIRASSAAAAETVAGPAGAPVNEPRPDGMLRKWNVMVFAVNPKGIRNKPEEYFRSSFDRDYLAALGGQGKAVLSQSTSVEYVDEAGKKATAQVAPMAANSLGWLVSGWDETKYGRRVVYAFCKVKADKAQKATWYFGSGDEANIWVNGELVHETYVPRPYCEPRQDEFAAELKEGLNTVMVKASQRSMNWEFMLEVHSGESRPAAARPKESKMSAPVTTKATVKREADKVWIEGVPDVQLGSGAIWISQLKGLRLLLAHRGETVTLDELSALSGDAFHLAHGARWELRTAHAIPTDPLTNAAEARGFQAQWTPPRFFWELKRMAEPRRKRLTEEYLASIRSHIDSGMPVLLGGTHGLCAEWRVAVGYDRPNGLICYAGGEQPYEWTELVDPKAKELGFWDAQVRGTLRRGFVGGWIGNAAFLLGPKRSEPTRAKRYLTALRRAVELHNAKPNRTNWYGAVTYWFGRRAYQQWAKDLRELDYPADVSKDRPKLPEIYNVGLMSYQADQIVRGRTAAAEFCQKAAEALPKAKTYLQSAAKAYQQEAAIATKAFPAFLAGTDKQREAWLSDEAKRERGVKAIEDMLAEERVAIAEIAKALAAEGVMLAATPGRPSAVTPSAWSPPDYSKLRYEGNGHTQDTFSLSVQAAAKLLGVDADYETIYCLSGNAFAPAINKGEDCIAWWHVYGGMGDRAMATVAGRLGLNAERLALPPDNLDPKDPKDVYERKALVHRKACAAVLRQAMQSGAVVINSDGWQVRAKEGLAPWCWWGIVTKVADDGDIRGACLGADPGKVIGFRDRRLEYLGTCLAISPAKPGLSQRQADPAMLRQAVARVRGETPYESGNKGIYGLAAMDAWIAQMEKVPFCGPCSDAGPKGMAGCAVNNVQTTRAGATAAASYLRKRKEGLGTEAQPRIEAAAEHYDRIAELLKPASWGFYRSILNDAAKQKAHAHAVLVPVKAELVAAADEMAKALEAEGVVVAAAAVVAQPVKPATSSSEDQDSDASGKVMLKTPTPQDLTQGVRWQVENIPIAIALRANMNVLGEDFGKESKVDWRTDHAYNLCLSATGKAYEMCMQVSKADGSMDRGYRRRPAAVDAEAYHRALEAMGHTGEVLMRPDRTGDAGSSSFNEGAIRAKIVEAIGSTGRPVIVQGLPTPGFYALVTGYGKSGEVLYGWSCEGGGPSILFEPEKRQEFANWFPSVEGVVIIKKKVGRLGARVHRRILTQAVAFLRRDESNGYLAGPALYEAWAREFAEGPAEADDAATLKRYNGWINPEIWD